MDWISFVQDGLAVLMDAVEGKVTFNKNFRDAESEVVHCFHPNQCANFMGTE